MKESILKKLREDNIDFYTKIVIDLGLLSLKNECAICNKKIDIENYHIQLCRDCRLIAFRRELK